MSIQYGTVRKYVQPAILVAFFGAAFFGLPISNCSIKIGDFRIIYPTGFLETSLLNRQINLEFLPGLILAGLLLIAFGRFYCGWICSASCAKQVAKPFLHKLLPGQWSSRLQDRWQALRKKVSGRLKLGHGDAIAILVGLLAGLVIFDFPVLTVFNPMGVATRSIVEMGVHHSLRFDLLLLAVPLLISLCYKNGWKSCCPEGLIQGFAARFNHTLIPVVNAEACNGCSKCQRTCPAGITMADQSVDTRSCQKCLQCIDVCPKQAVSLSFFGYRPGNHQKFPVMEPQHQARSSASG